MPMPTGNLLIIDGHGSTLPEAIELDRTKANRVNIYSYSSEGTSIDIDRSNEVIKTAIRTHAVPGGYLDCESSTDGGVIYQRRLSGPRVRENRIQWAYALPSTWGADTIRLAAASGAGSAELIVWYDGAVPRAAKTVLVHPRGSGDGEATQQVLLSTLLEYFCDQPYDVLWMACRSYANA